MFRRPPCRRRKKKSMPRRRSVATKWKLEGAERRPERHAETVKAALSAKGARAYSSAAIGVVNPDPGFSPRCFRADGRAAIAQRFGDVMPRHGRRAFE